MKGMKKFLAVACAIAMACPLTAFAAPAGTFSAVADEAIVAEVAAPVAAEKVNSGEKTDIAKAKVTVAKLKWTGKQQTAKVTVTLGGKTLRNGRDYVVKNNAKTNAGSYTLKVYGTGNYTGVQAKTFKIAKADQKITVKSTKSVSAAAVANRSKTFQVKVSGVKDKAKVSYKSNSKKITISNSGKITVKKGTKKGTKATITVTVAKTNNCNAAKKTFTFKVTK